MKKILLIAAALLAVSLTGCVEDKPYTGISNISQTPGSVTPDDNVTVTANTTNITSAVLHYKAGSAAEQTVAMTAGPNGSFSGVIPAQEDGVKVTYYVVATGSDVTVTSETREYTVSATPVDYSMLVLNEIDGNAAKSIELYNKGTVAIPLNGVSLIKNDTGEWWVGTSENGSIEPGAFAVIGQNLTAPWKGASGISPRQNLRFELKDPDGTVVSSFLRGDPEALGAGIGDTAPNSFQRCPNGTGDWKMADPPTIGSANPDTGSDIPQI